MRILLTPKWLTAHVVVLILGITCASLGAWQLERREARRLDNAVGAERFAAPPLDVNSLVLAAGSDVRSLANRRATAEGVFAPEDEVLIRSQVLDGRAGSHVVTPLVRADGPAILVNRGWVPLDMDEPPVAAAAPPSGTVTVEGVVRPSQMRGGGGRDDSTGDGSTRVLSRVDIDLVARLLDANLLPVYLEVVGEGAATALPIPGAAPDFADEGPHLNYAIQWFSFALIGVVGYAFLIRRELRQRSIA